MTLRNISLVVLVAVMVGGVLLYAYRDALVRQFFVPTQSDTPTGEVIETAQEQEVVAENLEIPWEVAFLPGGDMLVTERPGRLVRISGDTQEVIKVSGVAHRREGGLLGVAVHPDFARNHFIYLYLTTQTQEGLANRVERYTLEGATLADRVVIIDGIPGAPYHDGGRIAFGSDGLLYITTGDAGESERAQDTGSLAGKILRLNPDGSIPEDNPFGNAVYSYGHRNPQGIAWDAAGQLWATEHGRSGVRSGFDELNKIERGANYGWPLIQGDETRQGMRPPEVQSGPNETWAPAGAAYVNGHIVFAGLRGESLYVVDVSTGEARDLRAYLRGAYGRLRAVTLGPDGMLYVTTSNRDGRGNAAAQDDVIVRINPTMLGL